MPKTTKSSLPAVNKDGDAWCPGCGTVEVATLTKDELAKRNKGLNHGAHCDEAVERYQRQRRLRPGGDA